MYAISVDRINKRVTLTFRGTDNDLAFATNWKANINVIKSAATLPSQIKGEIPGQQTVNIHSGYYKYLFGKNSGAPGDPSSSRFDEVWDVLRPILRANRGYKLYVTGHSLGGALAIITSFCLACDRSNLIPKPVTCISFGAPRVGDLHFMRSIRTLEQTRYLRYCRVVNDNDVITSIPILQYHHAGVQVRLFRSRKRSPDISYPKAGSLPTAVQGLWGNSLLNNLNTRYDHSDYRERIDLHRDALWKCSLNDIYKDQSITGFK